MFKDEKIGRLLFLTHFIASLTVGIILKNYNKHPKTANIIPQVSIKSNNNETLSFKNLGKAMKIAIQNGISTVLIILGYMVFFGILASSLSSTGISDTL